MMYALGEDYPVLMVIYPIALLLGLAAGVGIVRWFTSGSGRITWRTPLAFVALVAPVVFLCAAMPGYWVHTASFWGLTAWGMVLVDLASSG